jgi:hypothetical protein
MAQAYVIRTPNGLYVRTWHDDTGAVTEVELLPGKVGASSYTSREARELIEGRPELAGATAEVR